MAFRPCSSCGQHFHGATEYTYVTWFRGEEKFAFRLAECSACVQDLRNRVAETAARKSDTGWADARYDLVAPVSLLASKETPKSAAS